MTESNKKPHRLEIDAQRKESMAAAKIGAAEKDPRNPVISLSQQPGLRFWQVIDEDEWPRVGKELTVLESFQTYRKGGYLFVKEYSQEKEAKRRIKTAIQFMCQKHLPEYYFLCAFRSIGSKRKNNPKVINILDLQEIGILDYLLVRHVELDQQINQGLRPKAMSSLYKETVNFNHQFHMKHVSPILGDAIWKLPNRW